MKIVKAIGVCALVLALVAPAAAQDKMITIGISQIVEHPALDAARQGFIDALAKHGYVEGKNVTYDIQIAQGNMATANSIGKALVGKKVDLIHSIATPTSQACVNATKDIPIIISSVTDPVGAGLVESLERPGGNVTGTTDRSPVDRQVDLILEIVPGLKKLGFIYNSGEDNSISSLNQLKEECAKRGIQVVEATVSNSSGVFMAAKSLVGRVDAIHIPTDNTVVSAFESVVKVCEDNRIPLFAADIDSVPRGAIAALAIDYYRLGWQSGEMAVRVLQGADPATMPVETLKDMKLYVNTQAAQRMGVTIPEAVVKRADKVL
ncbi:putative ABC transport system substrate-binding protein [Desulfacinum hydrothermale DSM 13146]|uniref:Putative ABC transport system substrate-binding protein n=1 Tax=Desulfacinum hydrothermale DSM 13146 TaxID=1121390 RepID=A0A1W1XTF1_9BACT|nr:ABC transporter substrate-binding protein [Desulfacinum hydrothermale]SMC27167.1 putative ABC transport system substrate-binding protein [Desulfacinum hydrothermale DSM 13146]